MKGEDKMRGDIEVKQIMKVMLRDAYLEGKHTLKYTKTEQVFGTIKCQKENKKMTLGHYNNKTL